jgi:hypothetical protein
MMNKRRDTGLLLSGLVLSGLILAAPAVAQSALAQQSAGQQSTAQSSKSSTAKSATAKPATKSAATTAKKSPPKPLVYVNDNRNAPKTADATASKPVNASTSKTAGPSAGPSAGKTVNASASKTTAAAPTQKPLSADVTKAFQQNCPNVALTEDKAKAGYDVIFEREPGAKGVKGAFGLTNAVHKTTKIEVTSKSGKELFTESGHSTGQLVKDACTAIGTPGTKLAKN